MALALVALTLVLPGAAALASLAELSVTVFSYICFWPAFLLASAAPAALAFLTLVFLAWLMAAMLGGLVSRAICSRGRLREDRK
jgi:hypothetical protein